MRSIRFFLVLLVVPGAAISSTTAVIGQAAVQAVVGLLVSGRAAQGRVRPVALVVVSATAVGGPVAGSGTA